tara:strand:+ start:36493 stop:37161 length:669 start_codon:yes stop_codon:yes gene_type:complete
MFHVTLNDSENKKNKIKTECLSQGDYCIFTESDSYVANLTVRDLPINPPTGFSFLLDEKGDNTEDIIEKIKKEKEKEREEESKKRNKRFRLNINITLRNFEGFKKSLFFDLIKKDEKNKSIHINNFEKVYKNRSHYNDKFSLDLSGSFIHYSHISALVLATKVFRNIQIHDEDGYEFFLFFKTLVNKNFDFYFYELNLENIEKYLNNYDKSLCEKYILFYKV